jgi:hypothetical protein
MLRRTPLALVILVAAGCGGSGGRADGGAAAGRDGGRDSIFSRFDVSTGGVTGAIDAPAVDRGTPAPGTIIYQGADAVLLGFGPSCTHEEGATGDRWCAFVAASPTTVGAADLFVFNASRAAAGTPITCGLASEPNCLKLTADFAEDPLEQLHVAFFQGDTLVYYDATATPFGWRPGMTAGRALAVADPTTADIIVCTPASKGTAILCLKNLPTQPNPNFTLRDLLVGALDSATTPPLTKVDSLITSNTNDGGLSRFQFQFLPDGQSVVWSTRMTATGPEILKMQRVGDDASRTMIGSDIHAWGAAPDGSHWTWLTQLATSGAGTLQSAEFPVVGGRVANASAVAQWDFIKERAVVFVTTQMAMSAISEPLTAPMTTTAIDTGVVGFSAISPQGDIAYAKTYDSAADLADIHVKRWDSAAAACTLSPTATGLYYVFFFTRAGGGAAWARRVGNLFELLYTSFADCSTKQIAAPGAIYIDAASDHAIAYLEDGATGSLSFRPLTGGSAPVLGEPTFVASQVGSVTTVATAPGGLVYSVNSGGNEDGIYFRTLP